MCRYCILLQSVPHNEHSYPRNQSWFTSPWKDFVVSNVTKAFNLANLRVIYLKVQRKELAANMTRQD